MVVVRKIAHNYRGVVRDRLKMELRCQTAPIEGACATSAQARMLAITSILMQPAVTQPCAQAAATSAPGFAPPCGRPMMRVKRATDEFWRASTVYYTPRRLCRQLGKNRSTRNAWRPYRPRWPASVVWTCTLGATGAHFFQKSRQM